MNRTIGLLGGGQLGQMLCEAANPLGIKIIVLDAKDSPAKQVNAKNSHVDGSFIDPSKIRELARQVDILTVEIEHVDTYVLEEIAETGVEIIGEDGTKRLKKVEVQPSWRTIRTIQDKFEQKTHLSQNGVHTAISRTVGPDAEDLHKFGRELGFPFMLKARRDAYDGRGNYPVKSAGDIKDALESLNGRDLYAEKWANFRMELAVMVVKTEDGVSITGQSTVAYPVVETVHEDSICKLVYSPPRNVLESTIKDAQELARKAVGCLWGKGVFGVEMFLMDTGRLIVNEIAPRPHNSGHYTIEACPTFSQYKSQLLSILGIMPSFPNHSIPSMFPATIMLNILGGQEKNSHRELMKRAMAIPTAALHMYGKESKPARKIGHVTVIANSMEQAEESINPLLKIVNFLRAQRKGLTLSTSTASGAATPLPPSLSSAPKPLIAVTMGSDSDLHILKPGLVLLDTLEIPFFLTITSAHRTPAKMTEFASSAVLRGFKVIIAAAGGAAHLPGMVAASTVLPVIGVPVKGSTLDGMDSLLSIVQMPRGVPVAAVAINNSVNAALLAARILGASDEKIREKLEKYAADMGEEVVKKAGRLEGVGFENY